ncbi:MAG: hypothetical protein WC766_00055 [Patescibacteria group bacterium]|jgi:hypothetical protein
MDTTAPPKPVKPKIGLNVLSCLFLIMLGFLAAALLTAFVVAKSGLLHVPIFSSFYVAPEPVRLLQAKPVTWDDFQVLLARRIYAQRSVAGGIYTIRVTEQELTGLLQGATVDALRNSLWEVNLEQIAVTPDYLEVFLKLKWQNTLNFDLLFKLKPKVDENGAIGFDVLEARLGDFAMPTSLIYPLVGNAFGRDLGEWQLKIGGANAIKSVSLLDRGLNIIINKQ